jgi:SWI/SNF-related matrix-associated actin-dependent regulator 1 of chromatin subfamily A
MKIKAQFRVLLTGTPLQNNLTELASILSFILPSIFLKRKDDLSFIFKYRAKTLDDSHEALLSAQRTARAKSMMAPFILRRKKYQVRKDLPSKTTRTVYCELTPTQREVYDKAFNTWREEQKARAAGAKKSKALVNNPMMQLRKAAIHPLLFRHHFNDNVIGKMARACLSEDALVDSTESGVFEDMEVMTDFELNNLCVDVHPRSLRKFALPEDLKFDSGKVAELIKLLKAFMPNGDRTLIFSQFTMVLDVLEEALSFHNISFFRLDGSTPVDERQDMIDQFYEETDVPVFLLSTKAGGSGINLACANKVVIFDMSFNPQDDQQAENRAHRVGQTRDVEVITLVSKGTVEEKIQALGKSKMLLDGRVSGDTESGATSNGASGGSEEFDGKKIEQAGEKAVAQMLLDGA